MSKQSDLVSVSQGSGGDPLYIDTTNDRVGVGTTSPQKTLDVRGELAISNSTTSYWNLNRDDTDGSLTFTDTNVSERMRIDSSGNLLVGKTSPTISSTGVELRPNGQLFATQSANYPLLLNRTTSDGDIAVFRKDNSTVGSIGNLSSTSIYINGNGSALANLGFGGSSLIYPTVDNVADIGTAFLRFDDIYATNGTIQTSDINEKQDIEALSDAEQRVAVAAKGLLRKYRWKDAVAEKGDAARIHFGIIAQDLQAAFEAEGLDASRYGMFISSTWWEAEVDKTREVEQEDGTTITETYTVTETYDEPTEGATERTRLGVRYPELLAFIIAAL